MSRGNWLVAFCLLVIGISLIGGCLSMTTPDEMIQAPGALSADYKLVDVTSSAGGSGKYLYTPLTQV